MADSSVQADAFDWRDRILSDPDMILEDRDLMRALIAANGRQMGENIVDMRGLAMERLEARLDRLEDTHRNVIAAAYENLAGTNQINRCVLRMLECDGFGHLLDLLAGEMTDILAVRHVRLVLEGTGGSEAPHPVLSIVREGFVGDYLTHGRDLSARQVTLRKCDRGASEIFGPAGETIRSEALLRLDLGAGRLPGLLAMGSEDANQFRANQGTELLTFFTEAFERVARRHLPAP